MAGDIHLDQRILVAVFPLDGFLAGHRGLGQEGKVGRRVLEHHRLVVGMNVGLHGSLRKKRGGKDWHFSVMPPATAIALTRHPGRAAPWPRSAPGPLPARYAHWPGAPAGFPSP